MSADGGDPAVGFGGLRVGLVLVVVRVHGFAAGLPGPDAAVPAGDDGLAGAAGDPAGFLAVGQAHGNRIGRAVGQMPGLPVRVQEEEPLAEGLGLDDAHARLLFDVCGFGFSNLACLPGPGLPVRVHDEDPAGGGDGKNCLRLPGQAGPGLLGEFRVQALAAGLVGVDLALPVHGQ